MSGKVAETQQKSRPKDSKLTPTQPTAVSSANMLGNILQQAVLAPDDISPTEAAHLQRTIGNQALGQMAGADSSEPTADLAQSSLQSILRNSSDIANGPTTPVQRQEEEEEVQAKADDSLAGGPIAPDLENSIQAARGNGRSLPDSVRQPMEQAFQTDFQDVKIHTHADADQLNRSLSAKAFTTGQDIFFRQGHYAPDTPSGKELLAHELTHVVQQNGNTPKAKLVVSQPGDRDEQEADAVGRFVVQHSEAARQADQTPMLAKINQMQAVQNSVQREDMGGKIGLAIGKGFLMSFVKAIAGPLMFFSKSERKGLARNWNAYDDEDKYVSKHLGRMGKSSTVFQQIGALAGWVSLLTGVGSLIAAAFAPAGLAAAAILGSISAIAGLVAAGAGTVTFGLSTILLISNLARITKLPKKSLVRKKAIIAAIQDGTAALSGLIAAVGGVVGAGMGDFQMVQSSSDIGAMSLGEFGVDLTKGSAAGQAFAVSDEIQGEVGGVLQDEKKKSLKQNPNFKQFQMGKEAMKKHGEIVNAKRLDVQRAPDGKADDDASAQVLQELGKVETAIGQSRSMGSKDKADLADEKQTLTMADTDLAQADKGIQQAKGIDSVAENLQQIEQESNAGLAQVEGKEEAEAAAPSSESEAEEKVSKLEEANAAIDNLESESGEKFGKKPSFFGKLKSNIKKIFRGVKRGAKKVGGLFVSAFVSIKGRLKTIFKKIQQRVTKVMIKVTGLQEPLSAVEEEVKTSQAALPETVAGTSAALEGIEMNEGQADQLQESLQEAKDSLQA